MRTILHLATFLLAPATLLACQQEAGVDDEHFLAWVKEEATELDLLDPAEAGWTDDSHTEFTQAVLYETECPVGRE